MGNLVLSNPPKERSRQKAHVSCLVTSSGFDLCFRHPLISLTIFRQLPQQPDSGPSLRLDYVFQFFTKPSLKKKRTKAVSSSTLQDGEICRGQSSAISSWPAMGSHCSFAKLNGTIVDKHSSVSRTSRSCPDNSVKPSFLGHLSPGSMTVSSGVDFPCQVGKKQGLSFSLLS